MEVAGTFLQLPVMTRWKSRAFDSKKVGRYKKAMFPERSVKEIDSGKECKHRLDFRLVVAKFGNVSSEIAGR